MCVCVGFVSDLVSRDGDVHIDRNETRSHAGEHREDRTGLRICVYVDVYCLSWFYIESTWNQIRFSQAKHG